MKKSYIYKGVASLMIAFSLSACSDFLDKEPSSNRTTGDETFSQWKTMEQFHYDTYNFLLNGQDRVNTTWLDAATDLAENSYNAGTKVSFNIGNYYASGASAELTDPWESRYRAIRKCNMILERIDKVPQPTDITVEDYHLRLGYYKGEAHAFRAWFYWELFLRYGPVPIVEEVLDPDGDLLTGYTTRPTIREFKDYLIQELDAAYDLVMEKSVSNESGNQGRINKPVVKALKSRILLYMASPRFSDESGVTWEDARDAAKEFIDLYAGDYSLSDNYTDAILKNAYTENNPETIFYRNDGEQNWNSYGYFQCAPVGEGGNGGTCPSQNLIDMYDMADGSAPFANYDETGAPVYNNGIPAINTASGYNDASMWTGRDPRLAASVLYQGVEWNGRNINVVKGAADNPIGDANATPTGYYLRKYMPEVILQNKHTGSSYRDWIIIRYAEILLNYAEAENELNGPNKVVRDLLDQIRHRGGITGNVADRTDLSSQDAMRNFIHKERTVEFAFEEHRWWDVRRWDVAIEALSRDIYGIDVSNNGTITRKVAQSRTFEEKMYLYPLPEEEVWKTGLENNPGWTNNK